MHIIFVLYYCECFPPYGFSEGKSKLTSVGWTLLATPAVTQTESSCSGDNDLVGTGERFLRTVQRVNSLVLSMRCYRAGDGFFKEE